MLSVATELKYSFQRMPLVSYNVKGYGLLLNCKLFKPYTDDNTVGQFLLHSKVCFIYYSETDLKAEIQVNIFKKSDYTIMDRKTGDRLGEYFLPNWTGPGLGKIGSISIGYETYECVSALPDKREKLFDSSGGIVR